MMLPPLEKPTSLAENSKEIRTPEPPVNPGECAHADTQINGAVAAEAKTGAKPPIAESSCHSLHRLCEMVMLSRSVLSIKWTIRGKPKSFLAGVGGDLIHRITSKFTLNQVTGGSDGEVAFEGHIQRSEPSISVYGVKTFCAVATPPTPTVVTTLFLRFPYVAA